MTVRKKKKVVSKATKKKTTEPTRPIGRPTKYRPEFCEIVIEKMAEGYSKEAVAGYLEISKQRLYDWSEKYEEFRDAISIGETKSQLHWETDLVKYKVHTKNGKQINGQVFNLNMKNRFGWTDKKEVELGPDTKKKFNFDLDIKPENLK